MNNKRKYKQEHVDFLKENYYKYDNSTLCKLFNEKFGMNVECRTLGKFCNESLNLNKRNFKFKFSPSQDEWLKLNYGTKESCVILEEFNDTFGVNIESSEVLRYRAKKVLKVKRRFNINQYSEEEIKFLTENYEKMTFKEMVEIMEEKFGKKRDVSSIQHYCNNVLKLVGKTNNGCYGKRPKEEYYKEGEMLGGKRRYVKIDNKNKVIIAKYYYEKYYNVKVKKEDLVIFLDGDKNNLQKENLYLIDRKIFAKLIFNGLYSVDQPVSKETMEAAIQVCKLFYMNKRMSEGE